MSKKRPRDANLTSMMCSLFQQTFDRLNWEKEQLRVTSQFDLKTCHRMKLTRLSRRRGRKLSSATDRFNAGNREALVVAAGIPDRLQGFHLSSASPRLLVASQDGRSHRYHRIDSSRGLILIHRSGAAVRRPKLDGRTDLFLDLPHRRFSIAGLYGDGNYAGGLLVDVPAVPRCDAKSKSRCRGWFSGGARQLRIPAAPDLFFLAVCCVLPCVGAIPAEPSG